VNNVARLALGAILGAAVLWACISLWGLLAVWISPWSIAWWRHHPRIVTIGREVLAVAPGVGALGLCFGRLYRWRPVVSALISMSIAIPVIYSDALRTPELMGPALRLTWGFSLSFFVGPALIVYLLPVVRSNNRWRGP
jgi:hypothetical protein